MFGLKPNTMKLEEKAIAKLFLDTSGSGSKTRGYAAVAATIATCSLSVLRAKAAPITALAFLY